MKVIILGGDGYLGWPQALWFKRQGHDVAIVDNFFRRRLAKHHGKRVKFLVPLASVPERASFLAKAPGSGKSLGIYRIDVTNTNRLFALFASISPDVIVHFAEIRSAPYSHECLSNAILTQANNVIGTLCVLWGMHTQCPNALLVKLGTMGEYGTPNIDIEEGYITIEHNGRTDTLPYPMQPPSFYHATKCFDSINIRLACKIWGLKAINLNQGPVYGVGTEDTKPEGMHTMFDYDGVWGTVVNRFCVEAAIGHPLTVYGGGGQTRGFIDIRDTMECIGLASKTQVEPGKMEVFNQITEQFSVNDIAQLVAATAKEHFGLSVCIEHLENPRVEAESHYYNVKHTKLTNLGLKPHRLIDALPEILDYCLKHKYAIDAGMIRPWIKWRS